MVGRIWVVGGVIGCGVAQGFGGGVTFSNRAAFEAAVGSVKRYNFETSSGFPLAPAAISSVDGGFLQFSSSGGAASLDLYGGAGNQALTGRTNNQVDRLAPVTIIPSSGQRAMGFDILDLGAQNMEGAFITGSGHTDRPASPYMVVG